MIFLAAQVSNEALGIFAGAMLSFLLFFVALFAMDIVALNYLSKFFDFPKKGFFNSALTIILYLGISFILLLFISIPFRGTAETNNLIGLIFLGLVAFFNFLALTLLIKLVLKADWKKTVLSAVILLVLNALLFLAFGMILASVLSAGVFGPMESLAQYQTG